MSVVFFGLLEWGAGGEFGAEWLEWNSKPSWATCLLGPSAGAAIPMGPTNSGPDDLRPEALDRLFSGRP